MQEKITVRTAPTDRPLLLSPWEGKFVPWNGTEAQFERMVSRCTLILRGGHEQTLRGSVAHYSAAADIFSEILILWKDLSQPLPSFAAELQQKNTKGGPRVRWLQSDQDQKALPLERAYAQVRTECAVLADDHLQVPHDATRYAVKVWRGDFFEQIVGHLHYARGHQLADEQWVYPNSSTRRWSLVLPRGGGVFHRELLKHYDDGRYGGARSATGECGDILLNFLATHLSGRGPAVVDSLSWAERVELTGQDPVGPGQAEAEQHRCLSALFQVFGSAERSLVSTTSVFKDGANYGSSGLPGRHHYKSASDVSGSWVRPPDRALWYLTAEHSSQ